MDDDDYTLDEYVFQEAEPVKKVILYVMDARGHTEDILTDIEDIYNYVNKLYADYPEGV